MAGAVEPWIRSYAARRGRISALTASRMERLYPPRSLPEGVLNLEHAFARRAPVVLEVGCGHGAAAIAYAQAHPEHDLLAVDVFTPGIARMLAAADRAGVPNLWVHLGDATQLLADRIPDGSLRALHLFFPDPWLKAKQAKRRFVSLARIALIASALEPGGALLVATDQAAYAESAVAALERHGGFTVTLGVRPGWRPVDGFEAKALAAGRPITEIRAELRG